MKTDIAALGFLLLFLFVVIFFMPVQGNETSQNKEAAHQSSAVSAQYE